MRVVFFGSGPFALPTLDLLASAPSRVSLLRVVTRPDMPRARGRRLAPTPVRARALDLGLPCHAPESAGDPALRESLEALDADLFIVADYGEILGRPLLDLPRIGPFNLHASLLPRYRGAAPVAHAILAGEEVTGVSLFRIERRLDAGPIVDSEEVAIEPLETAGELEERLAAVAARLLSRNLDAFRAGSFRQVPQDESLATLAPKLAKGQGLIDWDRPPREVANLVRAMAPWPGASSILRSAGRPPERTIFHRVRPAAGAGESSLEPGAVEEAGPDGLCVRCRGGAVEVLEIQREGRKALRAAEYLRGRPLRVGDRFARG